MSENDYDDLVYFEEEKVKEWLETAENFMKKLEKCIDEEIVNSGLFDYIIDSILIIFGIYRSPIKTFSHRGQREHREV